MPVWPSATVHVFVTSALIKMKHILVSCLSKEIMKRYNTYCISGTMMVVQDVTLCCWHFTTFKTKMLVFITRECGVKHCPLHKTFPWILPVCVFTTGSSVYVQLQLHNLIRQTVTSGNYSKAETDQHARRDILPVLKTTKETKEINTVYSLK